MNQAARDYELGYDDGYDGRDMRDNMPREYARGYLDGRKARNVNNC